MNRSSLIVTFLSVASSVNSFSAVPPSGDKPSASSLTPPKQPPTSIKIVGNPGGQIQNLPVQYVKSFQRWTLSDSDDSPLAVDALQGADAEQGFVNPTSIADLYWPSDIDQLQIRPTLEVLFSQGSPAYASGGVQVRVPPEASKDNAEWKNYGLSSQPLAHQWTTFGFTVEPNFRVEAFVSISNEEEKDEISWKPIAYGKDTIEQMKGALEKLGVLLSNLDETSPFMNGFHVLSIPTDSKWMDLERQKDRKQQAVPFQLVALATAEPESKELLSMLDDDMLAISATSILDVEVSPTEPGGESEYLPAAYKPLYKGTSQ